MVVRLQIQQVIKIFAVYDHYIITNGTQFSK